VTALGGRIGKVWNVIEYVDGKIVGLRLITLQALDTENGGGGREGERERGKGKGIIQCDNKYKI